MGKLLFHIRDCNRNEMDSFYDRIKLIVISCMVCLLREIFIINIDFLNNVYFLFEN